MGGFAIKNVRRLTNDEIAATYESFSDTFGTYLKFEPVGSYGKKAPGATYGDLDILIDANKMHHGYDPVQYVYDLLCEKYEIKLLKGIGVISIKYPIGGDEMNGFAQIDLLITNDIEWGRFVYYSPSYLESKYSSKYLGIVIMAIISEAFKNVKLHNDQIIEYEMLSYQLNKGISYVRKSYENKAGTLNKTPKIIESKFLTADPCDAMQMCFGLKYRNLRPISFEQLWDMINSDDFIHKNKLPLIISKIKHYIGKDDLPNEMK